MTIRKSGAVQNLFPFVFRNRCRHLFFSRTDHYDDCQYESGSIHYNLPVFNIFSVQGGNCGSALEIWGISINPKPLGLSVNLSVISATDQPHRIQRKFLSNLVFGNITRQVPTYIFIF
jgi:hypothetical protein